MADYIEREAAIKGCTFGRTSLGLVDDLRRLPAADVRPVVRGKWENTGSDVWKCSACGYGIMPWNAGVNFCPNCGAVMEVSSDG